MGEREAGDVHRDIAEELIRETCVLVLFAVSYGLVWPKVAGTLHLSFYTRHLIKVAHQLVIAFYALYQIPVTINLIYIDWSENR